MSTCDDVKSSIRGSFCSVVSFAICKSHHSRFNTTTQTELNPKYNFNDGGQSMDPVPLISIFKHSYID